MRPFQKSAKTSTYQERAGQGKIRQKGVCLSLTGIKENYNNERAKGGGSTARYNSKPQYEAKDLATDNRWTVDPQV